MKIKIVLLALAFLGSPFLFAQNCLDLDGVNDQINVGNPSNLSLSGTSFTVEAWVYPTFWKTPPFNGNVVNQENNSTNDGFMLRVGGTGQINFGYGPPGTGPWVELTTATNTLSLNTWAHIAATFDGSYIRIYKDGVVVDSMASTSSIGAGNVNLVIGARNIDRHFQGRIDEVRIWSVARTTQQINENMNTELCQAANGLELQYSFNHGTAGGNNAGVTTATDDSPNGNTGTLSGFALTGNGSNWIAGQNLGASGTSTVNDTICLGQTYIFGDDTLSTGGTYQDTIMGMSGCISFVTLNLHLDSIDLTTFYSGDTFHLLNQFPGATYQWISCSSGNAIFGETNPFYFPLDDGLYACEITLGNCTYVTQCQSKLYTSINESGDLQLSLYPNPAKERVTIKSPAPIESVKLLSLTGQTLREFANQGTDLTLSLHNIPTGVYYLTLDIEGERISRKLMVE